MQRNFKIALGVICVLAAAGVIWKVTQPDPSANPIMSAGEAAIAVLPISSLNSLEPLPEGWTHRSFWRIPAMELALVETAGVQAMRCKTNASASILMRSTHISLVDYPLLEWDWLVEKPIESAIDEATEEGDDHPIRLLLQVVDEAGERHVFEIIWSNKKYAPGDYKYIHDFPHYVANGLAENVGNWQHQQLDLLAIYGEISGQSDSPTLKSIGLFCDSDNTGASSIAYLSDVVLRQK